MSIQPKSELMSDRIGKFLRDRIREAGRGYERAKHAYASGKTDESTGSDPTARLPVDDAGRLKIVCRRHAERRAVPVDDAGRPACYDADHPDCQGCVEDITDGSIEVW